MREWKRERREKEGKETMQAVDLGSGQLLSSHGGLQSSHTHSPPAAAHLLDCWLRQPQAHAHLLIFTKKDSEHRLLSSILFFLCPCDMKIVQSADVVTAVTQDAKILFVTLRFCECLMHLNWFHTGCTLKTKLNWMEIKTSINCCKF